jgi:AraC-like DNA-binding protein
LPAVPSRASDPPADVLSNVLVQLRLRAEVVCRSAFSSPWGLAFPPGAAHFHMVERGTCYVEVAGQRPLLLGRGDLVFLPRGKGHRLIDVPNRRAVAYESVVGPRYENARTLIRWGGGGAVTKVTCGVFRFGVAGVRTVLSVLPALIHVHPSAARASLPAKLLPLLLAEATSTAPGSDLTTSRLLDILFVHGLQRWLSSAPRGSLGWVGALRDPRVGRAIAAIHGTPERSWTVGELAAVAGMSRSPFAARFTELVGEPPLKYVARWRMDVAAQFLQSGEGSVREAAERVGYTAEAAFSRAFKRAFGQPPSAYRRATARVGA